MGLQAQTMAAVMLRSDGPTFDQEIRDEDMAGAVFTGMGVTPWDLGVVDTRLARTRGMRGEPECVRGVGLSTRMRERATTS